VGSYPRDPPPHLPTPPPPRDLEVHQYDHYLRGFQEAAIQTEQLAATLNAGQAVVLSTGLTLVLISAVVGGSSVAGVAGAAATSRPFSPGDLVLLQGLLLQLWSPLQYLGWFWRCVGVHEVLRDAWLPAGVNNSSRIQTFPHPCITHPTTTTHPTVSCASHWLTWRSFLTF